MNINYAQEVLRLANTTNKTNRPSAEEWIKLEYELGVKLPNDYKLIVTKLGCGHFGDLTFLNPAAQSASLSLNLDDVLQYHHGIEWIMSLNLEREV